MNEVIGTCSKCGKNKGQYNFPDERVSLCADCYAEEPHILMIPLDYLSPEEHIKMLAAFMRIRGMNQ